MVSLTLFCSQNSILGRGLSTSERSQTVYTSNADADGEQKASEGLHSS